MTTAPPTAAPPTTAPPTAVPQVAGVPFARELARFGDAPALLLADAHVSYADLARRVEDVAARLGPVRRIVQVPGAAVVDAVVAYLACLAAGHVVLLVPAGNTSATDALSRAYDPDVVVDVTAGLDLRERRQGTAHDLHPDLALLLSTSGSTGSPKLVRLSRENVQANADAIVEVLGIRAGDRAATTLPLQYCYGLSVLHSHLVAGAALILTEASVLDECFWTLFAWYRGTTLAGVPSTFELLDRSGFAERDLPHLRYITQAGGRLDPERVVRFAELGRRRGWDLVVMYGQTEATARMAVLPPDRAATRPTAIGRPVPGGRLRIEPLDGACGVECPHDGCGELVYAGPNVMMGYATSPADLAAGRTVTELRTGDLARCGPDGLFELVGRRSRFVKVLGVRVDLDRVETVLRGHGVVTCCGGRDDALVLAVEGQWDVQRVRSIVSRELGLPARAVEVRLVEHLPRLASGKPDYAALDRLVPPQRSGPSEPAPSSPPGAEPGRRVDAATLCRLYEQALERRDVTPQDSFVSLHGDSLSYVALSVRLEAVLGALPPGWHTTSIADLAAGAAVGAGAGVGVGAGGGGRPELARRRTGAVETSVALRALAIVLVVGSHADLFSVRGGAHLLLAVAGFNLARFHLTAAPRPERVRGLLAAARRIAVPSIAWIGTVYVLTDDYLPANVLLVNQLVGPDHAGPPWRYWFVEALVAYCLVAAAAMAVPAVDRWQRRWPFAFALALVGAGLLTRYEVVVLDRGQESLTAHYVFWLFALGWAAAAARTRGHRLLLSVLVLTTLGFFGDPWREGVVVIGYWALVWWRTLPCPPSVARPVGAIAAASLMIYLTHWHVLPPVAGFLHGRFGPLGPLGPVVVALSVGVAAEAARRRLRRAGRDLLGRVAAPRAVGTV